MHAFASRDSITSLFTPMASPSTSIIIPQCIGIISSTLEPNGHPTSSSSSNQIVQWVSLCHNNKDVFVYTPGSTHSAGHLNRHLSLTLIPFLGKPSCKQLPGPAGNWKSNLQRNPGLLNFIEGVLHQPPQPLSQDAPSLSLMIFAFKPTIHGFLQHLNERSVSLIFPSDYDPQAHAECPISSRSQLDLISGEASITYEPANQKILLQIPSGCDLDPQAPPPNIIRSTLLPHQQAGLSFLMDRESPTCQAALALWKKKVTSDQHITWEHHIT